MARLPLWLLGKLAGLGPRDLASLPFPCTAIIPLPTDNLKKRITNINRYLTYNLYSNVCRSLFEKHKLMFAFLLCARIMMNEGKINQVCDAAAAAKPPRTDCPRSCLLPGIQGRRKGKARL